MTSSVLFSVLFCTVCFLNLPSSNYFLHIFFALVFISTSPLYSFSPFSLFMFLFFHPIEKRCPSGIRTHCVSHWRLRKDVSFTQAPSNFEISHLYLLISSSQWTRAVVPTTVFGSTSTTRVIYSRFGKVQVKSHCETAPTPLPQWGSVRSRNLWNEKEREKLKWFMEERLHARSDPPRCN